MVISVGNRQSVAENVFEIRPQDRNRFIETRHAEDLSSPHHQEIQGLPGSFRDGTAVAKRHAQRKEQMTKKADLRGSKKGKAGKLKLKKEALKDLKLRNVSAVKGGLFHTID